MAEKGMGLVNEGLDFPSPPGMKPADGTKVDPIVVDLKKDAAARALEGSYAHFDYDGDGFAERTAWIGVDQGLLAMDRNGNGAIDDGGELFGSDTILSSGKKAVDGLQALAELDGNMDDVIDSLDPMAGRGTSASGRGKYVDARQLGVIEKFYGERFENRGNPDAHSDPILTALYGNVRPYSGYREAV